MRKKDFLLHGISIAVTGCHLLAAYGLLSNILKTCAVPDLFFPAVCNLMDRDHPHKKWELGEAGARLGLDSSTSRASSLLCRWLVANGSMLLKEHVCP